MQAISSWGGQLEITRSGDLLRINDRLNLSFWLEIDLESHTARGRLESDGKVNPFSKVDMVVQGNETVISNSHVPGVWVKINKALF